MKWRPVSFSNCQNPQEEKWIEEKDHKSGARIGLDEVNTDSMDSLVSLPVENPLYHNPSGLSLNPYNTHHYPVQPTHPTQPQLSLDILASMQPELDHHSASAPTTATATDYSQGSLPNSLCHSQDALSNAAYPHDANDFDFNGGHITISGAFDPSINLSAYDDFSCTTTNAELDGLHPLAGLEHDTFAGLGLAVCENGELISVPGGAGDAMASINGVATTAGGLENCYPAKPSPWHHHANLISSLEHAADSYHDPYQTHPRHPHRSSQGSVLEHTSAGHTLLRTNANGSAGSAAPTHATYAPVAGPQDLVAHSLHDGHTTVNPELWHLASPFHEDTSSGAMIGGAGAAGAGSAATATGGAAGLGAGPGAAVCRPDGTAGGGLGMGVLELIERDQRRSGY